MAWSVPGRLLALMLAAVLALAGGETLIAKGMKTVGDLPGRWTAQVMAVLGNGWIWAGGGLLLLHLALYMAALGKSDLSLVLPLTALSYPLTALLASYTLGEHVGLTRWVGTALITAGVAVAGLGESLAPR